MRTPRKYANETMPITINLLTIAARLWSICAAALIGLGIVWSHGGIMEDDRDFDFLLLHIELFILIYVSLLSYHEIKLLAISSRIASCIGATIAVINMMTADRDYDGTLSIAFNFWFSIAAALSLLAVLTYRRDTWSPEVDQPPDQGNPP